MSKSPKSLIIVENLTLPLDRRVWQEATALRDAGHSVSVICPKGGQYQASYELLDGVHIFRHPMPLEADGALGYAVEYSAALFWEFVLSIRVAMKVGFDTVQACNPPDLIFIVAAFWKYLFGKAFIFDHHDINPELYEAKFGRRGLFHRLLKVFERLTFAMADASIATNATFRDIAIARGRMDPDRVFIVHSVPNLQKFVRTEPSAALRGGAEHVIGYVGIMGAQDGVDLLIEAMDRMVTVERRDNVKCVIVGTGTELPKLQAMVAERGLADVVTFTGFLSGQPLMEALSTFDVGVIPDPKNGYNDKISMNKLFEYMTLGIPFVQFDLVEGRRTAGDVALYAADNSPIELAAQIGRLLDSETLRSDLAEAGKVRADKLLSWDREAAQLLAAYRCARGEERAAPALTPVQPEQRPV
ncbi:MAG: glycosyltransferase family 4 protein [Pseudomonadota bacterium]